jgi:hypothetical protein
MINTKSKKDNDKTRDKYGSKEKNVTDKDVIALWIFIDAFQHRNVHIDNFEMLILIFFHTCPFSYIDLT